MKTAVKSNIRRIVGSLQDKKAVDILVLDVRDVVSYTDYMILCSGTSSTHVDALVSSVEDSLRGKEKPLYRSPSKDNSWWVLDFVDVVVHVFKEETRLFYNLEELWGDAKVLKSGDLK